MDPSLHWVQHDKTTASRQGLSTEIAHCPANYRQQFHIELVEKKWKRLRMTTPMPTTTHQHHNTTIKCVQLYKNYT